MKKREYLSESWISAKMDVRKSPLHGLGLFATAAIGEGEMLTVWGGDFSLPHTRFPCCPREPILVYSVVSY